jgi:hypothetical protein
VSLAKKGLHANQNAFLFAMAESISDIEVLALRCNSDQSKEYIAEAIRCYKASAYRACIVSTWIAIVFDLIDKIRELSVSGEAVAKALETKHETYISQIQQNNPQGIKSALEFEREILETCRDQLQFFDPHQFVDLIRIREDRHRCAHPSFQKSGIPYYPSAEQARVHIRNAVVHVLAQPPIQGKAALAQLKILVSSSYFPTDLSKAIGQIESSGLKKATSALIIGFVDLLLFGFLDNKDILHRKDKVLVALNATHSMYPDSVETRLGKQLNKIIRQIPDQDFVAVATIVANVTCASSILEQSSIDKICIFISNGLVGDVLSLLGQLSRIEAFTDVIKSRIDNLSFEEIASGVREHDGIRDLVKERVMKLLEGVKSWISANNVMAQAVMPLFPLLTAADVERIIRMPTETDADLRGANGYAEFIKRVRDAGVLEDQLLDNLLESNGVSYLQE